MAESMTGENERAVREMAGLLRAVSQHRERFNATGELKIVVAFQDGLITDFRFMEETIRRVRQKEQKLPIRKEPAPPASLSEEVSAVLGDGENNKSAVDTPAART